MNKEELNKILNDNKNLIDELIVDYFNNLNQITTPMLYALDSGKRIRANLYIETAKMLGKKIDKLDLYFALALEMIHAYSLVHDDLPCMDDDDMRRGKEALHIKFGEDMAILTGDALLNEASFLLFDISDKDNIYIKAGRYVMEHTGYKGMIEGQVKDIKATDYDLTYLLDVYDKKTADLFKASIVSAALVCDLNLSKIKDLSKFAYYLGISYQLQDDLLEDKFYDELNILNIKTRDQSNEILDDIDKRAKAIITKFDNNEFLLYLIKYLSKREK